MTETNALPTHHRFEGDKHAFKAECARRRTARFVVIGNTYPAKDAIKAAGGIWDRSITGWLMPDQETTSALADHCASLPEPVRRPRRPVRRGGGYRSHYRTASHGYTSPGYHQNPRGRCEDAPCCGCCD